MDKPMMPVEAMSEAQVRSIYLLYAGRPLAGPMPNDAEMRQHLRRLRGEVS